MAGLRLRLEPWLGSAYFHSDRWIQIQGMRKEGGGSPGFLAGKRSSRWPKKRTHAAEGPGARGKFGKARRSAVNSVGAKVLAGEVSRRRRGAADVARTPASLG